MTEKYINLQQALDVFDIIGQIISTNNEVPDEAICGGLATIDLLKKALVRLPFTEIMEIEAEGLPNKITKREDLH